MTPESGPQPDPVDWDAIARFFAGESPDAEIESVSQWLAANPDEAAALATLNDVTRPANQRASQTIDVEAAWRRTAAQLDAPRESTTEHANDIRPSTHVYGFP